jgi:DNA-directed RNA polymerase specialized sigma24 family protein
LTPEDHDAQDGLQDALERAWRARNQLRDPAASGGWLRSILARTVIDAHRGRADLTTAAPSELDLLIPDVEDAATSRPGMRDGLGEHEDEVLATRSFCCWVAVEARHRTAGGPATLAMPEARAQAHTADAIAISNPAPSQP